VVVGARTIKTRFKKKENSDGRHKSEKKKSDSGKI
jgi:hypothetical protein